MSYLNFIRDNGRWLLAGFLLSMTSSFGQTFFISVFAGEIMAELGLSDGQWGGIYTIGTTASAVVMVWAGGLVDRFRARELGAVVLGLLALSCLAMAAVPSGVWLIFVIFALRFTGQGMTSHIAIVSLARWFIANRGRALSLGALGFAVGQAVLPVGFVMLLGSYGWRQLWVVSAVLVVLVVPVLRWLLVAERTPQSVAGDRQVAGMAGLHWNRMQALRHPLFWLMVPTLLGPAAWGTALFFQQVHIAEVKGWSHAEFVALFPLFTAASVVTTFASGWAIDRFGTARLMPFYMLPFALAFAVLSYAETIGAAGVGMMLVGLAVGTSSTLPSAFWAEFYGTRNLGTIKALVGAVMVLGSAIGPGVSGWLIDTGVDFPHQMMGIAIYFVVAAAMATMGVALGRRALPEYVVG